MTIDEVGARVAEVEAHVRSKIIPKYEPVFPGTWPSIEMRIMEEIKPYAEGWDYKLSLDVTGHVHFHVTKVR